MSPQVVLVFGALSIAGYFAGAQLWLFMGRISLFLLFGAAALMVVVAYDERMKRQDVVAAGGHEPSSEQWAALRPLVWAIVAAGQTRPPRVLIVNSRLFPYPMSVGTSSLGGRDIGVLRTSTIQGLPPPAILALVENGWLEKSGTIIVPEDWLKDRSALLGAMAHEVVHLHRGDCFVFQTVGFIALCAPALIGHAGLTWRETLPWWCVVPSIAVATYAGRRWFARTTQRRESEADLIGVAISTGARVLLGDISGAAAEAGPMRSDDVVRALERIAEIEARDAHTVVAKNGM